MQDVLAKVAARDPEQSEFLQAVEEVLMSLEPVLAAKPQYAQVLERMCEPERLIMFRWVRVKLWGVFRREGVLRGCAINMGGGHTYVHTP
jgi:hypothetical protein